jgi:hypothetical protein
MLNSEERRRLKAIERQLWSEDPGLARRLAGGPHPIPNWARAAATVLVVLVVFAVVVGAVPIAMVLVLGPATAVVMMFALAMRSAYGW